MMDQQAEIERIIKFKQEKTLTKVIEKFPYQWTNNQLKTMQAIIKNTPRIRLKDQVIRQSILEKNNFIQNKTFIEKFFELHYTYNIINLMNTCGYTYLDFFQNEQIIDAYNKDASFNGFNFSKESLLESLNNNNSYVPFYAYRNKNQGYYLICGGRHRMQVLKNTPQEKLYLCIFWDVMPQKINCKIWIPKILLQESLFLLNLKEIDQQKDFSEILISDATDLWLVLRVLDKEFSFLIDFYPQVLKDLKITPPEGLMWKWK